MKIYLLKTFTDNEGEEEELTLLAFKNKDKAEALRKECQDVIAKCQKGLAADIWRTPDKFDELLAFSEKHFGVGKYLWKAVEVEEMELIE